RCQGGVGGRRRFAERQRVGTSGGGALAFTPPRFVSDQVGGKAFGGGQIDAWFATAVGDRPAHGDDVGEDGLDLGVGDLEGGDHAIAVEGGLGEDSGSIGGVFR